jgi:exonuclease SbcC
VQITTRIQELKNKEPLNVMAGGDYRAGLARVRDDATKHLALIRAAAAARGSVDVLRRAVVDAAAKVGEAKRARALEQERHTVRQAQLSELKGLEENLARDGVLETSGDLLWRSISEAAAAVAAARKAADVATHKQAEASAADAAAQKAVAAASDELARAAPLRATMEERLARYEQEWGGAKFSLPLSETTLDAEQERLDSRRTELDAEASAIPPMSGALQNWQDSLDLQRLEMQVREAHGAISREEHTKVLEAAVVTAKKARDDAERARAAAEDLNDRLQSVTAEFGGIALKPFGELFKRYLKALIHDDRFHNIEAVYAPSARSAGLSFRVLFGGAATEAEYLLSEGQLGEVSLAAMLAASTAFPWSRWRALLLDDPTQYNDLIHATALYDVLRNLVSLAGYQVFLSTHDQEQADFFRRKLGWATVSSG